MRSKMLHASALRPLEASLSSEHGVTIAKSIENLEPHELTDESLYKELYVYGEEGEEHSSSADAAAPLLPPAEECGGAATAASAATSKAARLQKLKSNRSAARGGLHA